MLKSQNLSTFYQQIFQQVKMQKEIAKKLQENFNPDFLEVINNSHLHQGHAGDNGSGNTHFLVKISCKNFQKQTKLQIHRQINKILAEFFAKGLHALEIKII
jgi:BolA protein